MRSRRSAPTWAATATRTGTPNPTDTDDDGDFLPDSIEEEARTNPCVADSDGDKLLDGWEYLSALDLNHNALPYPGKRPYPNALFADAGVDHDGDGLWAWAEHLLWWKGGHKYPLDYSDGDQQTAPEPTGSYIWNDWDFDGILSDDERDFDRDGIANIYELRSPDWQPWEPSFPGTLPPDWLDPDTDGDGVLDGWDDQDHDDISNIEEFSNGTWLMNPCDPVVSRVCPRWLAEADTPQRPAAPVHHALGPLGTRRQAGGRSGPSRATWPAGHRRRGGVLLDVPLDPASGRAVLHR